MGALSPFLRSLEDGSVLFWCPGCKTGHQVRVSAPPPSSNWGYNGNPHAPTFTPSILARSGHYIPGHDGAGCWCDIEKQEGEKPPFSCFQCHSFVTDGQIQFLSDCSHELAGQTVPLPVFPGYTG